MNLPRRIPRATYRVQLHKDFTFADLGRIVPYLAEMGFSDVYASPIFRASPGSTHGYDVCDHREINPELGGKDGLLALSKLLKEHNLGLLVDFVPNHMSSDGAHNKMWMDVLENGTLSRYSHHFDIDWNPRQAALQDRIILPILHDFYGRVLEGGEFHLLYENDAFWVEYRTLRLPLCPESYRLILHRLVWLRDPASPVAHQIEDVADRFRKLPTPTSMDNLKELDARRIARDTLRHELASLLRRENLLPDLQQVLQELTGTEGNPRSVDVLHQVLEEQHYRLAYWKTGTHEINYRRFFAVDSLVGMRMERPDVFEESHAVLRELIHEGVVDGVRIDHIDGLWNPGEYLRRLAGLAKSPDEPFYSLVEKILTDKEEMRADWMTHGTTGYDFAGSMINLLVAQRSENEFSRIYREFAGVTVNPSEEAYRIKLYIMDELFPNALDNFALDLELRVKSDRRWRDWTVADLRPALSRIIACLSVYRTYRVPGEAPAEVDIQVVERAVSEALHLNASADPVPYHFIRDLWTGRYPDEAAGEELKAWADEWICKLQQYTGAIMAKSVEDTFFYRYVRLFGANEVGHHPEEFGRAVSEFHEDNRRRREQWPASMLGTSTHDTKTAEDVRCRLIALSEIPERWDTSLHRWSKFNHGAKTLVNNVLAPDANEEYLLYQILLGAWPLEEDGVNAEFTTRIKDYMQKALAESKVHTNWSSPNQAWIDATNTFVETLLDRQKSAPFWEDFVPFALHLADQGMKMALVQIALKLTVPGVPDFYQGTEVWDLSLVDPDNRRPVNFQVRQELASIVDGKPLGELLAAWRDGGIKLRLIRSLLKHRQENAHLYAKGSYVPLNVAGPHATRFVAFLREEGERRLFVVALRRINQGDVTDLRDLCKGTTLPLPAAGVTWRDVITGKELTSSGAELPLAEIFGELPVAIFSA